MGGRGQGEGVTLVALAVRLRHAWSNPGARSAVLLDLTCALSSLLCAQSTTTLIKSVPKNDENIFYVS